MFIYIIILNSFGFVYDVVIALNLSCFFRCKIQHWFLFLKSSICLMTERWVEWQLQIFADKLISNLSLNWCFTLEDEYLVDPVVGDNTMNSSTSGFTSYKETTSKTDGNNAGNAKVIMSMSGQIGEELPSVSMIFFETTTHERETERFQEFLLCLFGNLDDNIESDIFGGPIFAAQHHELFSSQVNKLIWVHYVHINLKK